MLRAEISEICGADGALEAAVAFHDYETETGWSWRGERWFHAASTIKLAILVAVFDAVAQRRFELESWLHVRNRFVSRHDGEPYRIDPDRDSDREIHAQVGRALRVRELCRHMITSSSNLATNLLLDLVRVRDAKATLAELDIEGIELVRGVEDLRSHEGGLDNRVTAHGLLALLRALEERRGIPDGAASEILEILSAEGLRSGIVDGLPEEARSRAVVANKTGEISTMVHDAAIVRLPDRAPYALVVLTAWEPGAEGRRDTVAKISRAVYGRLVAGAGGGSE